MRCPSEAEVLAFVDGSLSGPDRAELERHIADCEDCRILVSALAKQESGTGFAQTSPADDVADVVNADVANATGPERRGDVLAEKSVVERVLGVGGMGVVVAAHHRDLAQRVALKFLLPAAFEAPGSRARFLREARAAASIKSEHVARVMDVGTLESGAPYLVMEYLEGRDLGAVLREDGPLAPALAVDYVLQASEAIAEAHALGIVHRDLKPANLFRTERADGTALIKVLDFGLSKAEGGSQGTLTTASSVMGSPRYMSPEQLRSSRDVDARTDIWALGVILYELVTGEPPWKGGSMLEICTAIATEETPPLRAKRKDVPRALELAVEGALQKDLASRTADIAELAAMLRPVASAAGVSAIERIVRLMEQSGRQRPVALKGTESPPRRGAERWALVAGVLLAVGGAFAVWSTRPTSTSNITGRSPEGTEERHVDGSVRTLVTSTSTPTSARSGSVAARPAASTVAAAASHKAPPVDPADAGPAPPVGSPLRDRK